MADHHRIPRDRRHFDWDKRREPAIVAAPGDTIEFEMENASDGQVGPDARPEHLAAVEVARSNPVTGPVFIDGARPGDALVVELLDHRPTGWGYTAVYPGSGLLVNLFPGPALHIWSLERYGDEPLSFAGKAQVPADPFCGTIGVAGDADGPLSIAPPRQIGGNLDWRHLRPGSTLFLPVEVDGALFSMGDPHAAQGDGEICGTAIECRMDAVVRLSLLPAAGLRSPRLVTRDSGAEDKYRLGSNVTSGIGPDLLANARAAASEMVDWLAAAHGFEPVEAYMLCSVCADLRISSVGGPSEWLVTYHFPLAVLEQPKSG